MRIGRIVKFKFIQCPKCGAAGAMEFASFKHCQKCRYEENKSGIFGRVKNPTHISMSAEEIMLEYASARERPSIIMIIRPIEEWDFWESKQKSFRSKPYNNLLLGEQLEKAESIKTDSL